ncbi:MAG: FAD-binding oxidoreductase [Rhodobacteraceae bacterium]|nr:FAD-binding oxidoreductase [Paracoccaceae bacterium]
MDLLTANDRAGAYPDSWYAATTPALPEMPPLTETIRADVCVVGGGYTGLSAALHMARAGRRVVVLEAQRVGFGASGRNGGQVLAGQRVDQRTLEARVGRDDARRLFGMSLDSVALVRALIDEGRIACDWRDGAAHMAWTRRGADAIRAEADHLRSAYGYDRLEVITAADAGRIVNTEVYAGGILDHGSGHLNPLAFALGLARMAGAAGGVIHERSRVTRIDGTTAITGTGQVHADHLILACNGYLGRLHPGVAARVMPINNFIIATDPLPDGTALRAPCAVADDRFVVNYYRMTPDNRLLFGGGESYGYRFPSDIAALVRKPLTETFPYLADVPISHAWGGTLAITASRMPHVARPAPGLWSVSGYSGHGVALATLAGRLIAEAIAGDTAALDVFARVPTARFPGGAALRAPLLATAMTWYALRDRIGF